MFFLVAEVSGIRSTKYGSNRRLLRYCSLLRRPETSGYYPIYRTKVRIIRQTAEISGANCSLYTKNARIYMVVVLFFSLFIVSYTSVDDDSYFSWKIAPEIGFQFDKKWDAGVSLGYTGVENGQKVFELAPYVRYTVCGSKVVDFFIEGTVGYAHYDNKKPLDDYDAFEIGLKPGLKVNLSNHVAFVTKIGFLGYQRVDEANTWGFDVDGRNVMFGINYKF